MWKAGEAGAAIAGIRVPGGMYAPKTDSIKGEVIAAAKKAGLENFNVKIGDRYYDDPKELKHDSIAKLAGEPIAVEPYDIAG